MVWLSTTIEGKAMLQRSFVLGCLLLLSLGQSSCGGSDDSKGACVGGPNPRACGDDFTAGQCTLVNGDAFHEGKTCRELGYR
jgi:hypothetical protein